MEDILLTVGEIEKHEIKIQLRPMLGFIAIFVDGQQLWNSNFFYCASPQLKIGKTEINELQVKTQTILPLYEIFINGKSVLKRRLNYLRYWGLASFLIALTCGVVSIRGPVPYFFPSLIQSILIVGALFSLITVGLLSNDFLTTRYFLSGLISFIIIAANFLLSALLLRWEMIILVGFFFLLAYVLVKTGMKYLPMDIPELSSS
jgi:hypothetical protein